MPTTSPTLLMTAPLPELCDKIRHSATSFAWSGRVLVRVLGEMSPEVAIVVQDMTRCMGDVLDALTAYCAKVGEGKDAA